MFFNITENKKTPQNNNGKNLIKKQNKKIKNLQNNHRTSKHNFNITEKKPEQNQNPNRIQVVWSYTFVEEVDYV